jgi:hypothetical protein
MVSRPYGAGLHLKPNLETNLYTFSPFLSCYPDGPRPYGAGSHLKPNHETNLYTFLPGFSDDPLPYGAGSTPDT